LRLPIVKNNCQLLQSVRWLALAVCILLILRPLHAAEPITLEFWDFPHLPKTNEYLARAIAEFERENPGVRVRYTRLPWQDGQQKITLAVLSGQPPDVCGQVSTGLPGFIAQDVLEPLNEFLAPELPDFHESYIDAVSHQGKIYAVPWYKACYIMLLNRDLFEKFGVTPPAEGRWTWEEFLASMKKLTHVASADTTTTTTTGSYYGLVTNMGPMEYEAYNIIFNFGGRILERTTDGRVRSAVADAPFVAGLKALQSLEFEHGVTFPGTGAATQEQSWSLWRDSRRCAVTIQGAWCITAVERTNQNIEASNTRKRDQGRQGELEQPIRWMIAAPPMVNSQTTPVLGSSGLGTYVVFRQKDPARRALAAKFALKLVSGEGQKVLIHENVFPSRKSAGNPFAGDARLASVFELFPAGIMSPLVPGGERIDKVLQQQLQQALLRKGKSESPLLSADEACHAADLKIQAVLDRARRRFGGHNR